MREILFRGKRSNSEWVEGFYYQAKLCRSDKELYNYITIPHPECDGQPSDHIMIAPETVGQFTGLTDKNGKKIFEGDIVEIVGDAREFITEDQLRYVVNWQDEDCGFRLLTMFDYQVIGNIHDNPELLEVTDNA